MKLSFIKLNRRSLFEEHIAPCRSTSPLDSASVKWQHLAEKLLQAEKERQAQALWEEKKAGRNESWIERHTKRT